MKPDEVRKMSDKEIIFYSTKFTEEYLIDEGWTKPARTVLFKRFMKVGFKEKEFNGEMYVKVSSLLGLSNWAVLGGWKGADDFLSYTGVSFEEIKDTWFTVVHGRVFLKEGLCKICTSLQ